MCPSAMLPFFVFPYLQKYISSGTHTTNIPSAPPAEPISRDKVWRPAKTTSKDTNHLRQRQRCDIKVWHECSIPASVLPSWVSLEDTLKDRLSEPSELLLRHTREGMFSSRRYRVIRLLMVPLPRVISRIGMSAEWLTGSPANSQTKEGTGFPWELQVHRNWDKILTQREDGRISAATETQKITHCLYMLFIKLLEKIRACTM